MRVPIVMPNLDCGDESVVMCSWLVEEGDLVLPGDLVAEVLIPGITFQIASEGTGRLVEIIKLIDTAVRSGDVLAWLEEGANEPNSSADDEKL